MAHDFNQAVKKQEGTKAYSHFRPLGPELSAL
uniref:Uncharacterized protein n=1 Tax=Anguilla anguilla TaxID=7936 RepID=A0A0E9PY10_ANGAN